MREERLRLGLSQSDFAALAGQKKNSQINYEGDKRAPDSHYLAAIAAKGADIAYIVTGIRSDALVLQFVDDRELVPIPLHAARLAAGTGAENHAEPVIEHLAFRADWLKRVGVSPSAARLASVQGDSMAPTLQPGDLVLIDTTRRTVPLRARGPSDLRPSPIFALRHDDGAVVKRLERVSDDQLILLSDNPAHPPQLRSGADLEATEIIGKVVWWGHTVRE